MYLVFRLTQDIIDGVICFLIGDFDDLIALSNDFVEMLHHIFKVETFGIALIWGTVSHTVSTTEVNLT